MENLNKKNLEATYKKCTLNYEKYKNLMANFKEIEIGTYSLTVQELFYSITKTLEIIQQNDLEDENILLLSEIDNYIISVRIHLITLKKMIDDPFSILTIDYLTNIYQTLTIDGTYVSDEEIMLLYEEILKCNMNFSPIN